MRRWLTRFQWCSICEALCDEALQKLSSIVITHVITPAWAAVANIASIARQLNVAWAWGWDISMWNWGKAYDRWRKIFPLHNTKQYKSAHQDKS